MRVRGTHAKLMNEAAGAAGAGGAGGGIVDNSAASALSGAPAANAGAPAGGGSPPAAAGGAPAAGDWLTGVDADTRAWIDTKGFKTPADIIASQRNLEKLIGGDKIPKPKGDDDKAGWDQLYKSLGRPDKPDGYKLPIPEGADDAMVKAFAPKMHELGLTQKQAAGLTEFWNGHVKGLSEADATSKGQKSEAEVADLHTEWGGQFDANVEAAKRAVRQFGIDKATMEGIEGGIGTGATYRLMAKLGLALGEDGGVQGDGKKQFASTKEQALHEISTLKGDKDFLAAYQDGKHGGHAAAVAKMENLFKIAYD